MRALAISAIFLSAFLFGCSQQQAQENEPMGEVFLLAGENYTVGEPIAFQLKTTNYSIIVSNRSGGYAVGASPSLWICRQEGGNCTNIEYRQLMDFSRCEAGAENIYAPPPSLEQKSVYPAEGYSLLFLWDQKEWSDTKLPCGVIFVTARQGKQVPRGNYTATLVYWVSWSGNPRSASADFRII